jgi:hypothetical protein
MVDAIDGYSTMGKKAHCVVTIMAALTGSTPVLTTKNNKMKNNNTKEIIGLLLASALVYVIGQMLFRMI